MRVGLLLLCLLVSLGLPAAARAALPCVGDSQAVRPLTLPVGGQEATGIVVAPAAPPTALVVLAHGYSFGADGMRDHARRVATKTGALVVAMDYRGLVDLGDDPKDPYVYKRSRGWPVKAGGEDLVAAAQAALVACPTVRSVALLGISMGANAGGLALAQRARRADGRPLFDYFVGIEGVYDLRTLYELARVGTPVSPFVAQAREDIERETGGSPQTAPEAYAERTVLARADDVAAAGLRGVALVHGVEDGLAVYPQFEQFGSALRDRGVPTDLYRVFSRGPDDDPDTTVGGYAGVKTGNAGHGPEVSMNHIVIDTGFARLDALLAGAPAPCGRDFRVEGAPTTSITPDPDAASATCPRQTALSRAGVASPAAGARPRCAAPRIRATSVRRAGRDLRVALRVTRRRCAGVRRGTLEVRLTAAGRRTTRVLRTSGRTVVRLRGAARATRLRVTVADRGGRSTTRRSVGRRAGAARPPAA